jgi:hypothetical protein
MENKEQRADIKEQTGEHVFRVEKGSPWQREENELVEEETLESREQE